MLTILILFLIILWGSSGIVYYIVVDEKDRERVYYRALIAVWSLWLEIAYVRVENGKTTYKDSLRKWWSHASHMAFHTVWIVKVFYPLWVTEDTLIMWGAVAASIDSVLILGLASHSVALATAYHFGKKQEIEQVLGASGDVGER